ncbi:hypothetical protein D0T87_24405, partial [Bacteroides sp. 51]|nr:hypothetical protein [Bacteroides sp. 51]
MFWFQFTFFNSFWYITIKRFRLDNKIPVISGRTPLLASAYPVEQLKARFNSTPGSLPRPVNILRISHPVSKLKSYEY